MRFSHDDYSYLEAPVWDALNPLRMFSSFMSPHGMLYSCVRSFCKVVISTFFREVDVVGLERIPLYGPVIFVGNHTNQFVDGAMLIAKLPRVISFLVARKSFHRPLIGPIAKAAGCIPVARPQDNTFRGKGKVYPCPGYTIIKGEGTQFMSELKAGDRIKILAPKGAEETSSDSSLPLLTIAEIEGEDSLRTCEPCSDAFKFVAEKGGAFECLPKVDQSTVYDAVNDHLRAGGCIGVFPEGGSHDRTQLLPLKPGVAIMALSSLAEGADDVTIVPVGLNYYQGHRFRSQAVVEIGMPMQPSEDLVERYQQLENRRQAVSELLTQIEKKLRRVILVAADYEEQMFIRLAVALYRPERTKLSRESQHAMQQLFGSFWECNRSVPDILSLQEQLRLYNAKLKAYGVTDTQVWRLRVNLAASVMALMYRTAALILSLIIGGPPTLLWGPIWLACWYRSKSHQQMALRESKVKIKATDVLASYKIMVALALVPLCNFFYSCLFSFFVFDDWYERVVAVLAGMALLPSLYYASLRQMEKVVPLARSIRTLVGSVLRSVNLWRDEEREIAFSRMELQLKVREVIHDLGKESLPKDFLEKLNAIMPKVVVDADSRRINSRKESFVPKRVRTWEEDRQEIL